MEVFTLFPLILIVTKSCSGNSVEFNREYTGVDLAPYVKKAEGEFPIPKLKSYSLEDLKIQMKVISTKFSRVFTIQMDVIESQVPYVKNKTYYNGALIRARTGEAAAFINRQKGTKFLSVVLGIWRSRNNPVVTEAEVKVAAEAAQIANSIYPGTVEGLMWSSFEERVTVERTEDTINWIRVLRNLTNNTIKIGTRQRCVEFEDIGTPSANETNDTLRMTKKELIMASDFIVCLFVPFWNQNAVHGPEYVFSEYRTKLLVWRTKIQEINDDIEVHGTTYWPSGGDIDRPWLSLRNMRKYWVEVDRFASDNNYPIFFESSFDNPYRTSMRYAHLGWWKLTSNNLIRNVSGYVEKISVPKQISTTPKSTTKDAETIWVYTVSGVGVLAAFAGVMATFLYILYNRYKRMQTVLLTKEDIREFMYGFKEEHDISKDVVNGAALVRPYDKSLEIPIEKLEILRDQILGEGEFGRVYKALIRNEEVKEVALKTMKHDCPSTALKSLLTEIKILSYLGQHPNIVSICGAYTKEIAKNVVYLATELCPLGSLQNYLRSCKTETQEVVSPEGGAQLYCYVNTIETCENIPFKDLVRWSHEIACGMEYLEQKNMIHADLATRNVLLSSDATAKITDFGLSRRLYDFTVYNKRTMEPLPWRWMSLESLKRMEFSLKSDVWSFGVTMWEIFSLGDLPFPGQTWNHDFVEGLENGLILCQPSFATDEIYIKMRDCWKLRPEDRPTFAELRAWTNFISKNAEYS